MVSSIRRSPYGMVVIIRDDESGRMMGRLWLLLRHYIWLPLQSILRLSACPGVPTRSIVLAIPIAATRMDYIDVVVTVVTAPTMTMAAIYIKCRQQIVIQNR
jgi:hypothetical protein